MMIACDCADCRRADEEQDDALLCGWPPCTTPDCQYGVCLWADTGMCFPCSERQLGRAELIRRYDTTHEITWEEAERIEAEEEDIEP